MLNQWTADQMGAKIGDTIELFYFEPETTDGNEVETSVKLKLTDITQLTEPDTPFDDRENRPAPIPRFSKRPALANDPDLTPEVPGLTDAESVNDWDLPFETPGITGEDDSYWQYHRTTPKAFVSLNTGRKLWGSRFGSTTSLRIRIRGRDEAQIRQTLENRLFEDGALPPGCELVPLKRHGLAAATGSTPFDALFLSLSMFVIVSALLLVSILFRLSLQQRTHQLGLLSAIGLNHGVITRIWLIEMSMVSFVGAAMGVALGVGYAALMLYGLRTWWVGAISTPFIQLHVGWISIVVGALAGALVCLLTIWFSIWQTRKKAAQALLTGRLETMSKSSVRNRRTLIVVASLLAVIGIALTITATQLAGESQAGAFLSGGFCILISLLAIVWHLLKIPSTAKRVITTHLAALVLGDIAGHHDGQPVEPVRRQVAGRRLHRVDAAEARVLELGDLDLA